MPVADMSLKSILALWFPILLLGDGVVTAEYLRGIVGESVTFQVETNLSIVSISWSKMEFKPGNIAVVIFGDLCGMHVLLPAFENRVKISEDCRGLKLSHLKRGDRGHYVAEIFLTTEERKKVYFELAVESVPPKNLKHIVGESVTFQLKTNLSFVSISWGGIVGFKSKKIAVVTFGEPCGLQVPLPALENRVKVSEDCRELQLSHLERDDTGLYSATFFLPTGEMEQELFHLAVDRRLLDSEIRVVCSPDKAGKGAWELYCFTRDRRDWVRFKSPIYWTSRSSEDSTIKVTSQDLNFKVTCTAKNLISEASRTVSLKDVCSGQTKNLSKLPLWALLCLGLGGSLLLSGCMELIPMEKPRKADGGGRRRAQPHPGDD